MSELPAAKPSQWACRTQSEADAMIAWVNAELDRLDAIGKRYNNNDEDKWKPDGETPYWAIVMAAVEKSIKLVDETGDIEPLRRDLEHLTGIDLARFLKRPPRITRGDSSSDWAKKAAADVRRIRAIWRREFPATTGDPRATA